jgi:hypothetical protein
MVSSTMNRFNAFIDNIKDRLNNPIIFSFILSWVVFNWRIVIALFWDKPFGEIHLNDSLIEYVATNLDVCRSLLYPFLSALVYTLLSPPVKNLVVAFQNWNFRWGEKWNLSILKESKISIEKYFSLKENYEARRKNLETMIESEDKVLGRVQELEDLLIKQRTKTEELLMQVSAKNEVIDHLNWIEAIEGKWVRKIENPLDNIEEEIEISGNIVYLIKGNSRLQKYSISNFIYRTDHKKIQFCLYKTEDGKLFSFNNLDILPGSMTGTEYTNYSISEVKYLRSTEVLNKT